ncbi:MULTISPECIES: DUF5995 family protein [unclassified Pseudonocardia]|uniref:DUF5995 family protein n=1 Tax=unclassified Pseudonocardia TaxID=2619320 RepID=UPI00095F2D77|nr:MULTISPECIES: DUF5995 family protein [unclassified Pseudonocardia]MBN9096541.1 hypothetical protein [Pseudonocardia sp.]OJY52272.1 MAG: hypothetical protein BGP03_17635 [Pseudonocardia sp. 73-21]
MTHELRRRALTDPRTTAAEAAARELAELAGATEPRSIPEVLDRLDGLRERAAATSERGDDDGVAAFTKLYREITCEIGERDARGEFVAPGDFLAALDVQFAWRYFEAIHAYAHDPASAPHCWRVLFALREVPGIPMANFAAAGVNAHINYDLSAALLRTWNLGGPISEDHRPAQQQDYDVINEVFAGQMDGLREEMGTWLSQGDDGDLPDRFANWMGDLVVRLTRQVAWDVATHVWRPGECDRAVARSDRRLGPIAGDLGAALLRVRLPF